MVTLPQDKKYGSNSKSSVLDKERTSFRKERVDFFLYEVLLFSFVYSSHACTLETSSGDFPYCKLGCLQTSKVDDLTRGVVGRDLHVEIGTRVAEILCSQDSSLLSNQEGSLQCG